jgi:mono/diheme cytochrome c family protein
MRRWNAVILTLLASVVGLSTVADVAGATARKAPAKKAPAKKASAKGTTTAMIAQGKKFVEADGCLACHKVGTKGGTSGTDLNGIGKREKASEIAATIRNPKIHNPQSVMPASKRPDKEIGAMAEYLATLK